MAERLYTMSSVKLGGFWSQIEASCVSNHAEELWYDLNNLSVDIIYIYIYIYIYMCVCVCVCVLFNPTNQELGTNISMTNEIFKNGMSNLNNPGQMSKVNKIHRASYFLWKKIQQVTIRS